MNILRHAIMAVAVASLLAACDEDSGLNPDPEPPLVQDSDLDGIPNVDDRCPTVPETLNRVFDRDGCPDTPLDLYAAVRSDVEGFWAGFFAQVLGVPYAYTSAMIPFTGVVSSPCGPASGPSYCGLNQTVYLELSFMQDQLNRIGDFAAAVIIAHEIGHHTQRLLGILGSTYTIIIELQADCLAGRWAATAGARGMLDVDDIGEAYRTLFEVGDPLGTPWFDPRAHGSSLQRQQAFAHGLANGAC